MDINIMTFLKKTLFSVLVLIAMPATSFAQIESLTVSFNGDEPTIIDFARAYCSECDNDSFERIALAALTKGNSKNGKTECIVDSKNGYVKYTAPVYDELQSLEMCYWNCDNKNEKLVAVNSITTSMGFDESFLYFYRYNVKNKTMTLIEPPFSRDPDPLDLVDQDKADRKTIEDILGANSEDSNRFMPCFSLPRNGKDITYHMADPDAIPKQFQREGRLIWNGSGSNTK